MRKTQFNNINNSQLTSKFHFPTWLIYLILSAIFFSYLSSISAGIIRETDWESTCVSIGRCLQDISISDLVFINIGLVHNLVTYLAVLTSLSATIFFLRNPQVGKHSKYLNYLGLGSSCGIIYLLIKAEINTNGYDFSLVNTLFVILIMLLEAILVYQLIYIYQNNNNSLSNIVDRKNNLTSNHLKPSLTLKETFTRLVLMTIVSIGILFFTGGIINYLDVREACTGWPLCNGFSFSLSFDSHEWINNIHRVSVFLSGILVTILFITAWKHKRLRTVELVAATSVFILFFAQALMGARLTSGSLSSLLVLHQSTAAAVWIVVVMLISMVSLSTREVNEDQFKILTFVEQIKRIPEFFKLTKPVVVILLLVTTFAGMVIAGQEWPSLSLVFWTLLGGFFAAGGSGAVNQYIDRFDDTKMQRTQNRPIPSGRITPGESLAFGIALLLISFYIMTAFVNLLAALLTLAGIIYYVVIYSILLKKTTVRNIVIGGGAGAIPPLVGWAAVTQSLNIPSLFLFAIIFMWTPPHFWALAIVRKKDYARAGVPMLPVVRGEKETRWQILIYTIQLVLLTLLLPLIGLGGSIYLIGAVILGAWLLLAAWRVWKIEGNKVAWKMYRYSSMYLAFLFILLMVDRLIL